MFIPVGDEVRKKHFSFGTALFIVAHLLCFFYFRNPDPKLASASLFELCHNWGISSEVLNLDQYDRLLTYWIFEKSILSLISTLYVLFLFGPTLENRIGFILFSLCYVASGSLAGLAYCYLDQSALQNVSTVGAAAGLIGAYSVLVGLNINIRTIFFWGLANVPAVAIIGLWLGLQYFLAKQVAFGLPVSPWIMLLPGLGAGIVLGFCCLPIAPNKITILRGEKWIETSDPIFKTQKRRTEDRPKAATSFKMIRNGACCPCCHTDISKLVAENQDAQFYYCPNRICSRLIFRTQLT